MKKKRKPRRKRCENCGILVPQPAWEWGLCPDCMEDYCQLNCIVLSHTISKKSLNCI